MAGDLVDRVEAVDINIFDFVETSLEDRRARLVRVEKVKCGCDCRRL